MQFCTLFLGFILRSGQQACILPGECTLHWSQWENESKWKQWERGRRSEWTELFLGKLTGSESLRPMLNWCLTGTHWERAREKENERQERQGQFCITQVSNFIWFCTASTKLRNNIFTPFYIPIQKDIMWYHGTLMVSGGKTVVHW